MKIDWKTYNPGNFYDEMISTPGNARVASRGLASYLQSLSDKELASPRDQNKSHEHGL